MKHFSFRFCCLMTALLILSAIPGLSAAAPGQKSDRYCGNNLTWTLDEEGLLTISGTGEMDAYTESSSPWNSFKVKKVVLEEGVTSIGSWAFSGCHSMTAIEIPESVTEIGDYAFYRCYQLKSISLPDSILSVGANPFRSCSRLEEIVLSPDHPVLSFADGMLSSKPDHRLVCRLASEPSADCIIPDGIRVIGDYAFYQNEEVRSVTIPEGVAYIGISAFNQCDSLTSVDFPQGLVSVGDYAFAGSERLSSARFREGLTSIGTGAFHYCWALKEIDLPDTLTSLGSHPFNDCRNLSVFRLSSEHPLLGFADGILYSKPDMKMIFYAAGNPAEHFTVPEGIHIIGEMAFANVRILRSVTFPGTVWKIEKESFRNCSDIEELVFSEGLEEIGDRAFYDMSGLTEIILPEGVASIGNEAFAGCSKLEKIWIPESVESIGKGILAGTDTLNLVVYVMPDSVGEQYCLANDLTAVYPGEKIPEPEVELPEEFVEQYPGYKGLGTPEQPSTGDEPEDVYLAKTPEGEIVLLCGVKHGDDGWTIIESAPLPAGSRVVLDDGLRLIDVGNARCTVCRYYGDVWGIWYTGWRDIYVGPKWIGFYGPPSRYFGVHPWADLTTIDWVRLSDRMKDALKALDVSSCAFPHQEDPEGRTPVYVSPDPDSEKIADLVNGVMLDVTGQEGEWTHVSIGRDGEDVWKPEGWIRTADLEFRKKADLDHIFRMNPFLGVRGDAAVTLVTPLGREEIQGFNRSFETWFPIGEKTENGQEYWLVYETLTEQIGFVLKEEVYELK